MRTGLYRLSISLIVSGALLASLAVLFVLSSNKPSTEPIHLHLASANFGSRDLLFEDSTYKNVVVANHTITVRSSNPPGPVTITVTSSNLASLDTLFVDSTYIIEATIYNSSRLSSYLDLHSAYTISYADTDSVAIRVTSDLPPRRVLAFRALESRLDSVESAFNDSITVTSLILRELMSIQDLVLSKPEYILSMPLLKKDIEALKSELELVKENTRQLYDLFQWLIGTVFLGLLALTFTLVQPLISAHRKKEIQQTSGDSEKEQQEKLKNKKPKKQPV